MKDQGRDAHCERGPGKMGQTRYTRKRGRVAGLSVCAEPRREHTQSNHGAPTFTTDGRGVEEIEEGFYGHRG